ncbi:MAG TPA: hydroxyacid dehydrogenase [bacterium]|nr:hydroxyacid dehydrogenase [bacterium]
MRIAIFDTKAGEKKYFSKALAGQQLEFSVDSLDEKTASLAKNAQAVMVFVASRLTAEVLKKMPKLKLVIARSTGFDHIDLKYCQKNGITVCNVPSYGENTVAEHAFALILSLSRNIHKSYLRTIREDYRIEGLKGFDLHGKTIGVVGAGKIGLHLIKMARGFDMNVLAYDVNQDQFLADVLGFKYVSLENLLAQSDIISLHVPDNKFTHHLINRKNIGLIKKGALLINTARGGVVETEALLEALDKKILAGAGLDVVEGENLIMEEKQIAYDKETADEMLSLVKNHILLSKENVIFTPHIAFYSQEAIERIMEVSAENVLAFVHGQPKNIVKG